MAGKVPGPTCLVRNWVNVKDGTSALVASPKAGPTRSPEDVSFEIGACFMPVKTNMAVDPAQMQVLAALRANRSAIVKAEQTFRIDRRAIAGAAAWEMLENVRHWSPRSSGWGKVHLYNYSAKGALKGGLGGGWLGAAMGAVDFDTVAKQTEDRGYLPPQTFADRKVLLSTPEGAIKYIAASMAAFADIAERFDFEDIRGNPTILTNVFQAHTLKTWEDYLGKKPAGSPFAAGNTMAVWVRSNLTFLEEAVGQPDLPESQPGFSPGPGQGKIIAVVNGMSLSGIAGTEYGSQELWPLIYDENKAKIGPDPNLLRVGLRLSIAPLTRYTAEQIADAERRAPSWKNYK